MRDVRSLDSRVCGQDPDWKMEGDEVGEAVSNSGRPERRWGEQGISLKVQQWRRGNSVFLCRRDNSANIAS